MCWATFWAILSQTYLAILLNDMHHAITEVDAAFFTSFQVLEAVCSFSVISSPPLQGDQVGRIFAHWVKVYFRQFFYQSIPHFCASFPQKNYLLSLTKMGWATFWAVFS
jgi:hypothetical protein